MPAAARYLLLAQIAFWSAMLLCLAIAHGGLGDNHGFSFYGGRLSTILPYAIGFLAAAALITQAAALLDRSGRSRLAAGLRILVVLLLADLLTPDSLGIFVFQVAFGALLVIVVASLPDR